MPGYRIEDEFQVYTFAGRRIAGPVSTREPDAPGSRPRSRWMTATLYLKDSGEYVLHTVNESLVWHLPDGIGHVRMPSSAAFGQLTDDAVYCGDLPPREGYEQCAVLPRRGRPPRIIVEEPQHKVVTLPDWPAVVREVTVRQRGDGSISAAVSAPMRELLAQARQNDPAFRGAKPRVRM